MKLLKQGAEGKLYVSSYLGKKCIVKVRLRKEYREQALDIKINTERIRTECNLLSRAKESGVRTPIIWKIDIGDFSITTEFIEGKTLKEELKKSKKSAEVCERIGEMLAKLHSNDIIHGDFTTSNIILHGNELVCLDFGLGEISPKIEDKAVDILAFKKTFLATHFAIADKWEDFEKGYSQNYANAKNVLGQMRNVEARARYY